MATKRRSVSLVVFGQRSVSRERLSARLEKTENELENEVAASGLAGRPGAMALAMAMQSSALRIHMRHMILHTNAANS